MIEYLENDYDLYAENNQYQLDSDNEDILFISNEELNDLLLKDNRSYARNYFVNSKSPNPKIKSAEKNNYPIKI